MYEWNEAIQKMIDWIEANITENPTLLQMSEQIGYSPYYCSVQFHKICGMTIKNYVSGRRIALAAGALRDTDERIIDIAVKYGFPFPKELGEKIINNDWVNISDGFLTKAEMQRCLDYLDEKLEGFWNVVNDDILNKNTWEGHSFTYLSVISAQIRHIMCHVGMCNAALIENGFDEVEWIAYGEN